MGATQMLKRLIREEGPFELDINKFSLRSPPFESKKNHGVHLLDVIDLPNKPPIMAHPLLRSFDSPPIQTFGGFVTFFTRICEVGLSYS